MVKLEINQNNETKAHITRIFNRLYAVNEFFFVLSTSLIFSSNPFQILQKKYQ